MNFEKTQQFFIGTGSHDFKNPKYVNSLGVHVDLISVGISTSTILVVNCIKPFTYWDNCQDELLIESTSVIFINRISIFSISKPIIPNRSDIFINWISFLGFTNLPLTIFFRTSISAFVWPVEFSLNVSQGSGCTCDWEAFGVPGYISINLTIFQLIILYSMCHFTQFKYIV